MPSSPTAVSVATQFGCNVHRTAGLLTSRVIAAPDLPSLKGPVAFPGAARRSQLRGQSRIWRLMATPHRIPFYPVGVSGRREPSLLGLSLASGQVKSGQKPARRT